MEIINQIEFTNNFWCVALPILLCIIDVVTGYVNAWKQNELSSKKMRDGLAKKFGEIVLCLLGWLGYLSFGIKLIAIFPTFYIVTMEITSIFENLDNLGVPIPKVISDRVNNIGKELEGKKDDIQ